MVVFQRTAYLFGSPVKCVEPPLIALFLGHFGAGPQTVIVILFFDPNVVLFALFILAESLAPGGLSAGKRKFGFVNSGLTTTTSTMQLQW
jgi:hypothetical protein